MVCFRARSCVGLVAVSFCPTVEAWLPYGFGPSSSSSLRVLDEEHSGNQAFDKHGLNYNLGKTQESIEGTPQWFRASLAALAMLVTVAAGSISRPARAESSVDVYFGQGCFWHVQNEFVKKEASTLGRDGSAVTSLTGYAGGNEVGDGGRVCYHNMALAPDYGRMGHTEVVNLSVPESKLGEFAKEYFDQAASYRAGRADPQDMGTEYRSAIGLPGGVDSPLFSVIQNANAGRFKLLRGEGNDADTVFSKKIWIYDSTKYPFHQGEIYHQFHDDMIDRYPEKYHDLKQTLLKAGQIKEVGCPEFGF